MSNATLSGGRLACGISSVLCPFAAVPAGIAYQSVAHAGFWSSLGPDDGAAAALMMFGEVVQLFMIAVAGCVVGLALALVCLWREPRHRAVSVAGVAGVGVNAFGLLVVVLMLFMGAGSRQRGPHLTTACNPTRISMDVIRRTESLSQCVRAGDAGR